MSKLSSVSFMSAAAEAEQSFKELVDKILGTINAEDTQSLQHFTDQGLRETLQKYNNDVTIDAADGTRLKVLRRECDGRGLLRTVYLTDVDERWAFALWPETIDSKKPDNTGLTMCKWNRESPDEQQNWGHLDSKDLATVQGIVSDIWDEYKTV